MVFIKQYGAKRSGTNYLKSIVHSNFEDVIVFSNILGWKHGCYYGDSLLVEDWFEKKGKVSNSERQDAERLFNKLKVDIINSIREDDIRYLISVKNPYSWMSSMIKYLGKDMSILKNKKFVEKHILNWNNVYRSWISLKDSKQYFLVVKNEDMLEDFDLNMGIIRDQLKLKTIDGNYFMNNTNKMRNLSDGSWNISNSSLKKENNNRFYIEKSYLKYFDIDMLDNINCFLNKDVMKKLGYEMICNL